MKTTVEKDATANDITDESKDKKREILPRYILFLISYSGIIVLRKV